MRISSGFSNKIIYIEKQQEVLGFKNKNPEEIWIYPRNVDYTHLKSHTKALPSADIFHHQRNVRQHEIFYTYYTDKKKT